MDILAGILLWLESCGRTGMTDIERETLSCHRYCDQIEYDIQERTHRQWTEPPHDGKPNEMLNTNIGGYEHL